MPDPHTKFLTVPAQWRQVADQLRPKVPKLAAFVDQLEADVLAYISFPKEHRVKIEVVPENRTGV